MGARRRLILALVLGGVGTAAVQGFMWYRDMKRNGTDRLVNQVWLERMPGDPKDMIRFFTAVESDGRRVGSAGRGSQWRTGWDLFVWRIDGEQLLVRFPQDETRARLDVRTWRCRGEAPSNFDLCLELRAGERRWKFFSRDAWRIRPRESFLREDGTQGGVIAWIEQAVAANQTALDRGDKADDLEVGEVGESVSGGALPALGTP